MDNYVWNCLYSINLSTSILCFAILFHVFFKILKRCIVEHHMAYPTFAVIFLALPGASRALQAPASFHAAHILRLIRGSCIKPMWQSYPWSWLSQQWSTKAVGCSHTSRRQPGGLEQAKLGVGVGAFPFWIRLSTVLGFLILRRENVSAWFQFPTTPTIGGDLLLPNLRCKYQEEAIDSQRHVRLEESARWGPLFFSHRGLCCTFKFISHLDFPASKTHLHYPEILWLGDPTMRTVLHIFLVRGFACHVDDSLPPTEFVGCTSDAPRGMANFYAGICVMAKYLHLL